MSIHVLLVEDDEGIRDIVEKFLAKEGYQVDACADGQTAAEKIYDGHYHLIILDVMLPGTGGHELLRECRKAGNTPVLMMTALTERERVNLTALAESVLPSCQTLAEAKKQRITISLPDALPCIGGTYILSRVLSNVLMNAVQNSPEGAEIRIWSEPSAVSCVGNTVKLCVLNTDARIDEAVTSKVCEPFYRADKARSGGGSCGLGLTIVKKALDSMDIPFGIENKDGGVAFWMEPPKA